MASRVKSEFLGQHEPRNPHTDERDHWHVGARSSKRKLDEEQREYLTTILDSAENLLGLLNDILDLSKIEAQKLGSKQSSSTWQRRCVTRSRPFTFQAKQKGIRLDLQLPPDVPERLVGDPSRLRQIMANLTENAVKFTSEGDASQLPSGRRR